MWTPKRLLLAVLGFVIFLSGYQIYVYYLGHYDGLQPLPEEHRPGPPGAPPVPLVRTAPRQNPAVKVLQDVFGPSCEEQHRRIILEWRQEGIVMAADRWKLLENGQLHLSKVSVVLLGKAPPDAKERESNTIRGAQAFVAFDKPITDLKDVDSRKPVAGKLEGDVRVQNNRGTAKPEDDFFLYTDWLAFRDDQHRLWTEDDVRLVDGTPPQMIVTASGMEVLLLAKDEKAAAKDDPKKNRNRPSIGGVKSVRLEREVRMDLLVDARSGFMGNGPEPKAGPVPSVPRPANPPEKHPVAVTAQGPFVYDVETDRAEFRERVNVIRKQEPLSLVENREAKLEGSRYDQLDCQRLVLQFLRKNKDDKDRRPDDRALGLELVNVHATGQPGEVVLVSDAERLHAIGNDLFYEAASKRTILKGEPDMIAEQDGNEIRARFLVLEGVGQKGPKGKDLREAIAQGPGEIKMKGRKDQPPLVATWQDKLLSGKDGDLDRLILTGDVYLEDPERGQIRADRLTAWLDWVEADPARGEKRRRLPRRVEAVGRVSTVAPELHIQQADRLNMQFEDAPATKEEMAQPPQTKPAAGPAKPPLAKPEFLPPAENPTKKAKQPIELRARVVEAKILRDGTKNDLHELHTYGAVHVIQKPATPDEQPVDIQGDALHVLHKAAGNVMQVFGQPAQVQVDKLFISGPIVNIDQPDNKAWVTGMGSMKMPSKTDFEGNRKPKPVDLIVHWKESMAFNGRVAEFDGGVNAIQENSRLWCQTLQVVLDKPLSLTERPPDEKKGPRDSSAALYRLLCDQNVRLVKEVRAGDAWLQFERVEGRELYFNNPESMVQVSGPGAVSLLKRGGSVEVIGQPPAPAAQRPPLEKPKDADQELKLTRVTFEGTMSANTATRVVTFTDRVELTHLPANDPDLTVDPDNLPPGGLWLRCGQLMARSAKIDEKTTYQEFTATGRVLVRAQKIYAHADTVKYDERIDRLIMEGDGANLVTLWQQKKPGAEWEHIRGKKIWYWRRSGTLQVDGTEIIRASP